MKEIPLSTINDDISAYITYDVNQAVKHDGIYLLLTVNNLSKKTFRFARIEKNSPFYVIDEQDSLPGSLKNRLAYQLKVNHAYENVNGLFRPIDTLSNSTLDLPPGSRFQMELKAPVSESSETAVNGNKNVTKYKLAYQLKLLNAHNDNKSFVFLPVIFDVTDDGSDDSERSKLNLLVDDEENKNIKFFISYAEKQNVKKGYLSFYVRITNDTGSNIIIENIFDSCIIDCRSVSIPSAHIPYEAIRLEGNYVGKPENRHFNVSVVSGIEKEVVNEKDIELRAHSTVVFQIDIPQLTDTNKDGKTVKIPIGRGDYHVIFNLFVTQKNSKQMKTIMFFPTTFKISMTD